MASAPPQRDQTEDKSSFPDPPQSPESRPERPAAKGRSLQPELSRGRKQRPGNRAERSRGPGVQAALPLFLGMAMKTDSWRFRLFSGVPVNPSSFTSRVRDSIKTAP